MAGVATAVAAAAALLLGLLGVGLLVLWRSAVAALSSRHVRATVASLDAYALAARGIELHFTSGPIRCIRIASASYGGDPLLLLRPLRALLELVHAAIRDVVDRIWDRRRDAAADALSFEDELTVKHAPRLPIRLAGVELELALPDTSGFGAGDDAPPKPSRGINVAAWRLATRVTRATELFVDSATVRVKRFASVDLASVRVTCSSGAVAGGAPSLPMPLAIRVHCQRMRAVLDDARASSADLDSLLLAVTLGVTDAHPPATGVDAPQHSIALAALTAHGGAAALTVCPNLAKVVSTTARRFRSGDASRARTELRHAPSRIRTSCKLRMLTVRVAETPIAGLVLCIAPVGVTVAPGRSSVEGVAAGVNQQTSAAEGQRQRVARSLSDPLQLRQAVQAPDTTSSPHLLASVPEQKLPSAKSSPFSAFMQRLRSPATLRSSSQAKITQTRSTEIRIRFGSLQVGHEADADAMGVSTASGQVNVVIHSTNCVPNARERRSLSTDQRSQVPTGKTAGAALDVGLKLRALRISASPASPTLRKCVREGILMMRSVKENTQGKACATGAVQRRRDFCLRLECSGGLAFDIIDDLQRKDNLRGSCVSWSLCAARLIASIDARAHLATPELRLEMDNAALLASIENTSTLPIRLLESNSCGLSMELHGGGDAVTEKAAKATTVHLEGITTQLPSAFLEADVCLRFVASLETLFKISGDLAADMHKEFGTPERDGLERSVQKRNSAIELKLGSGIVTVVLPPSAGSSAMGLSWRHGNFGADGATFVDVQLLHTPDGSAGAGGATVVLDASSVSAQYDGGNGTGIQMNFNSDIAIEWDADAHLFALALSDTVASLSEAGMTLSLRNAKRALVSMIAAVQNLPPPSPPPLPAYIASADATPKVCVCVLGRALGTFTCFDGATVFMQAVNLRLELRGMRAEVPFTITMSALSVGVNDAEILGTRGTNADGCGCDISLRRSQVGAPIFINVNVCKSMLLDLPADVDLGAIIGSMQTLFRAIDTIRTERRRTSQVTQRALGKPKWCVNLSIAVTETMSLRLAADSMNTLICTKHRDLADLVECGDSVLQPTPSEDAADPLSDGAYLKWCSHIATLYARACIARKAQAKQMHLRDSGWMTIELSGLEIGTSLTFFGATKFDASMHGGTGGVEMVARGTSSDRFEDARAFCRFVDPASGVPEAVTFPVLDLSDITLTSDRAVVKLLGSDEPLVDATPLTLAESGRLVAATTLWVDAARIPGSPSSPAGSAFRDVAGMYYTQSVRVGRSTVVPLSFASPGALPAMKIFTKLNLTSDELRGSYGVCMEPIFFEVAQAFRRCVPKTSPALFAPTGGTHADAEERANLQWWDVMAYKWHGEASFVSRRAFEAVMLNGTSCRVHDNARGFFTVSGGSPDVHDESAKTMGGAFVAPSPAFSLAWNGDGKMILRFAPFSILSQQRRGAIPLPLIRSAGFTFQLRYCTERSGNTAAGCHSHHLHCATQALGCAVPQLHTLAGTQPLVSTYEDFRALAATVWIDVQLTGAEKNPTSLFLGSATLLPLFAWLRDVVWIVPRHLRGLGGLRRRISSDRTGPSGLNRISLPALMRDIRVSVSTTPMEIVHWPPPGTSRTGCSRVSLLSSDARWFGRFVKSDVGTADDLHSPRSPMSPCLPISPLRSPRLLQRLPKSRLVRMSLKLMDLAVRIDHWPEDTEDVSLLHAESDAYPDSIRSSEPSTPTTPGASNWTHAEEEEPLLPKNVKAPDLNATWTQSDPGPDELVVLRVRLASLRFGLDEASADAQEIAEQKAGAAAAAAALDPTSSEHPRAAAAAAAAACAASAVPPGWYVTLDLPVAQYADTVPSLMWSVASDIAAAFPTKPTVILPRPSKEPKAGPSSGSDVGTIFAPHDGERAHAATEASSLAVDSNDGGLMALLDSGMLRPVRTGSMGTDGGTPTAEASDRPFRASSGTVDSEAAASHARDNHLHEFEIHNEDLASLPAEEGWRPRFKLDVIKPKALVHASHRKAWVLVECSSVEVLSEGRRDSVLRSVVPTHSSRTDGASHEIEESASVLTSEARTRTELRRVKTALGSGGLQRSRETCIRVFVETASISFADAGLKALEAPARDMFQSVTEGGTDFFWQKHRWLEAGGAAEGSMVHRMVGARAGTGLPHTDMRAKLGNLVVNLNARQFHVLLEVGMSIADCFQHPVSRATDASFEGAKGGAYRSFGVDFTPTSKSPLEAAVQAATVRGGNASSKAHTMIPWPAPSRFLFFDVDCRRSLDVLLWARIAKIASDGLSDRIAEAEASLLAASIEGGVSTVPAMAHSVHKRVHEHRTAQRRQVQLAESHYRYVFGTSLHKDLVARLARRRRAAPGLHSGSETEPLSELASAEWDDGDLTALESVGERKLAVTVGRTSLRLAAHDHTALARLEVQHAQFSQSARFLEVTGRREGRLRLEVARFYVTTTAAQSTPPYAAPGSGGGSSSAESRVLALWDPNRAFGDGPMVLITASLSNAAATGDAGLPDVSASGRSMHHFDHIEVGLAPLCVMITDKLATDLWEYFFPPTEDDEVDEEDAADAPPMTKDARQARSRVSRRGTKTSREVATAAQEGRASDTKDSDDELPALLSISYFRWNTLHLKLSYTGKPVNVANRIFVLDFVSKKYANFRGTLRQLLTKIRRDVVMSVFYSLTGLQSKKVQSFLGPKSSRGRGGGGGEGSASDDGGGAAPSRGASTGPTADGAEEAPKAPHKRTWGWFKRKGADGATNKTVK